MLFLPLLAAAYLAWQYVQPVFTILAPGTLSDRFGTVLGAVLVTVFVILRPRKLFSVGRTPLIWMLLLLAVGLLSALANLAPEDMIVSIQVTISTVAICIVFASLAGSQRAISIVLGTLVAMAALNAAVGAWGAVTGQSLFDTTRWDVGVGTFGFDPETGRSGGLRGENYVGVWVAPALAFGLMSVFSRPYGPLGITLAGLSTAGVAASFSRTSLICAIIVLLSCAFLSIRRGWRLFRIILVLFPLVAIALVGRATVQSQESFFTREVRRSQEQRWMITGWEESRRTTWKDALDVGLETPILGHGPGSSQNILPTVAHNAFLDMFVQSGLLGLAVFSVPPIWLIWFFFRNSRLIAQDRHLALLYAMFLGMLFAWITLSSGSLRIIWIVAGLVYGRIAFIRASLAGHTSAGEHSGHGS